MEKKLFEILCAKDEAMARKAAAEFIKTPDIKEFECLCEKMDFLFDFVRENVYKRLSSVINQNNFKKIINFFDIYCPYFDDFFSEILSKYADEDLTDEILEILSKGNDSQKTYAANYFKKIPDTVAKDDLVKNLETDFEPLFINCAGALGKMEDKTSLEKFLADLNSNDDFEKLRAVKFITAYGDKSFMDELFNAMGHSSIKENIAGEVASLYPPSELIKSDLQKGLMLFNHLINGLGEILPLENIFFYEIYDTLKFLLKASQSPEITAVLCNTKHKFGLLTENDEYIFDLDKNTKNEVFEIKNLIFSKSEEFWQSQKQLLKPLIKEENPFLETVLDIIKEEKSPDFTDELLKLINTKNETLLCEVASTLKEIGQIDKIDKSNIHFENKNLQAIFEQLFGN